jgi:hypothetical protein
VSAAFRWLPAALAALVVVAVAARAPRAAQNPEGFPYGDLKEVTLAGKLVSLQDELARKYGARVTADSQKQWALALPEGQYYTFLDTAAYRGMVAGKPADGAVEVKARHFPRSQILELLSFKPTGSEGLARRFYCPVCDIHFQDFGPCACCGKEVQLVK